MNPCQNCGKLNTPETNFCRFCGTKFNVSRQTLSDNPYDYSAPRPYAWKTDEFQTENEPRKTDPISRVQPIPMQRSGTNQGFAGAPMTYQQRQDGNNVQPLWTVMDSNYRCPRCGSSYLPTTERRISTAGWVVFSVLLVFTVIFFWIGLLMKEEVAVCPVCRSRVS